MNKNPFTVKVPATTANIGPGFDSLGLALDLWNESTFSFDYDDLRIDVEGYANLKEPDPKNNLIFRSFESFLIQRHQQVPPGIHIFSKNRIPMGSGMGSSSTAILMGLYAADAYSEEQTSPKDFLKIAADIEGHPDNVAPAIFGGLISAFIDETDVIYRQNAVFNWNVAIIVPEMILLTETSRKVLPLQIPMKDCVFNISHSLLLLHALQNGDEKLLQQAMKDKIHQPYRIPLIPGAKSALAAAVEAGAAAAGLSGAGPGLIAFTMGDTGKILNAMSAALKNEGLDSKAFSLKISRKGAFVEYL